MKLSICNEKECLAYREIDPNDITEFIGGWSVRCLYCCYFKKRDLFIKDWDKVVEIKEEK